MNVTRGKNMKIPTPSPLPPIDPTYQATFELQKLQLIFLNWPRKAKWVCSQALYQNSGSTDIIGFSAAMNFSKQDTVVDLCSELRLVCPATYWSKYLSHD